MHFSGKVSIHTVGLLSSTFAQWAILMIIPRVSNFNDAGVFTIAVSVTSILNIIATMTLNQYQVADQYQKYSKHDYFVCRLITIALSFILVIPISLYFSYSFVQIAVITAYLFYRNILQFTFLFTSDLQIENRLDIVGYCMLIEGIVSFISFYFVFSCTGDIIVATFIMALLGGGSFIMASYPKYRVNTKRYESEARGCKSLFEKGIPLTVSAIIPIVITSLPKLLLQQYHGDKIVGIFGTISSPTVIIPTLAVCLFAPFITHFSNISKSGNMGAIKKDYFVIVAILSVVCILSLIASEIIGKQIFIYLYGEEISEYLYYFDILLVGISFYTIGSVNTMILMTKEQSHASMVSMIISLLFSAVILIAMVPSYGMDGATYGSMIAYIFVAIITSLCVLFIPLGTDCSLKNND